LRDRFPASECVHFVALIIDSCAATVERMF
jgi:hypothetical protein